MKLYKLDNTKKMPYPSFMANVLRNNQVVNVGTLLTKPSTKSGMDRGAINMMHYNQDGRNNWYYKGRENPVSTWYYDTLLCLKRHLLKWL